MAHGVGKAVSSRGVECSRVGLVAMPVHLLLFLTLPGHRASPPGRKAGPAELCGDMMETDRAAAPLGSSAKPESLGHGSQALEFPVEDERLWVFNCAVQWLE